VSPASRPVSGMRPDLGGGAAGRRLRWRSFPRLSLSRHVSFTDRFTEAVFDLPLSPVFQA